MNEQTFCAVCGQPLDGEDYTYRHFFHDDDCPNHVLEMNNDFSFREPCDCDNPCHAKCCPVCEAVKL